VCEIRCLIVAAASFHSVAYNYLHPRYTALAYHPVDSDIVECVLVAECGNVVVVDY
jgi:hypothetical protein